MVRRALKRELCPTQKHQKQRPLLDHPELTEWTSGGNKPKNIFVNNLSSIFLNPNTIRIAKMPSALEYEEEEDLFESGGEEAIPFETVNSAVPVAGPSRPRPPPAPVVRSYDLPPLPPGTASKGLRVPADLLPLLKPSVGLLQVKPRLLELKEMRRQRPVEVPAKGPTSLKQQCLAGKLPPAGNSGLQLISSHQSKFYQNMGRWRYSIPPHKGLYRYPTSRAARSYRGSITCEPVPAVLDPALHPRGFS